MRALNMAAFHEGREMSGMAMGTAAELVREARDPFELRLGMGSAFLLLGDSCELSQPEAADWNQQLSPDARLFLERYVGHQGFRPQPNRPVCVLSRSPATLNLWRRVFGSSKTRTMATCDAMDEAMRRLHAAQEQEIERRAREDLPDETPGDTWIRVGVCMHRSPAGSPRLIMSVCEIYIWK